MKYRLERGMTIREVLDRWSKHGERASYRDHHMVRTDEAWAFREYTWSRDCSRYDTGQWDDAVEKMERRGWRTAQAAVVSVGRNGVAKVADGNHRLAIARALGIEEIPVRFDYVESVKLKEDLCKTDSGRSYVRRRFMDGHVPDACDCTYARCSCGALRDD